MSTPAPTTGPFTQTQPSTTPQTSTRILTYSDIIKLAKFVVTTDAKVTKLEQTISDTIKVTIPEMIEVSLAPLRTDLSSIKPKLQEQTDWSYKIILIHTKLFTQSLTSTHYLLGKMTTTMISSASFKFDVAGLSIFPTRFSKILLLALNLI